MKMIIDISEDAYKAICNGCMLPPDAYKAICNGCMLPPDVENTVNAIKNGTPMPEPHGRIVDESKIHTIYTHTEEKTFANSMKIMQTIITHTDAPTIIEGQYGIASEPFINKPCISEGVCHEDKMQTLDKLRAEIENHCGFAKEHHCEYCYSCPNLMGVKEILEVIDKYRSESEVNDDGNS